MASLRVLVSVLAGVGVGPVSFRADGSRKSDFRQWAQFLLFRCRIHGFLALLSQENKPEKVKTASVPKRFA